MARLIEIHNLSTATHIHTHMLIKAGVKGWCVCAHRHVCVLMWCLCACLPHLCSCVCVLCNLVYRKHATGPNTWSISPVGWVISPRPNPQLWFRRWAEQQGHAQAEVKRRLGGSPAELPVFPLQAQRRSITGLMQITRRRPVTSRRPRWNTELLKTELEQRNKDARAERWWIGIHLLFHFMNVCKNEDKRIDDLVERKTSPSEHIRTRCSPAFVLGRVAQCKKVLGSRLAALVWCGITKAHWQPTDLCGLDLTSEIKPRPFSTIWQQPDYFFIIWFKMLNHPFLG